VKNPILKIIGSILLGSAISAMLLYCLPKDDRLAVEELRMIDDYAPLVQLRDRSFVIYNQAEDTDLKKVALYQKERAEFLLAEGYTHSDQVPRGMAGIDQVAGAAHLLTERLQLTAEVPKYLWLRDNFPEFYGALVRLHFQSIHEEHLHWFFIAAGVVISLVSLAASFSIPDRKMVPAWDLVNR
jgi:hypothetical protein